MDIPKVSRRSEVADLAYLLELPEIQGLIVHLESTRWTGRPGYAVRTMVGLLLTKSLFALPTWTRTIALVQDHGELREVLDCVHDEEMPSIHALYRFTKKVSENSDALDTCLARVLTSMKMEKPEMGRSLALDGSDLPAYANGQRFVSKNGPERERFSDSDASWGHRSSISTRSSGGYYGFKLHAAVCTETDLPVAWRVESAKVDERSMVVSLLDKAQGLGFEAQTCAMDKGYDATHVYDGCEARDCRPIIPLKRTAAVNVGRHLPPTCEHGEWLFKGADYERSATKWVCPTGECKPATKWIKASRLHTLIPRSTPRWKDLYSGRASVEREFGRLKHEWGLTPLRVRGLDRVRMHANLTILAKLGCALLRAREEAVPLAA